MHSTTSELIVHDDAIRQNTAYFHALTRGRLMAVLKSDAFGHGDVARSVLESGAESIGVTCIDEALALRATGVAAPVLSWLNTPDADFEAALLERIDLAVPNAEVLYAIARAAGRTGRIARVHLHVDVGINRDGCPAGEWAALCALAREHEAAGTLRIVGVMGHMSCADDAGSLQNRRERLVFENAIRTARRRGLTPQLLHLAATAATLSGVGDGFGIHRIGAGLFGIDPSRGGDPAPRAYALRPALTLNSTVVSSRAVAAGTGIGYGHDFIAASRTHLALLPVGYGDGLPRVASGRAEVFARGRRRPVVGRFSMDMIVVDTGDDLLAPGESVTVFGPGDAGEPTVAEWAAWSHTIEHEILTSIGSRSSRVHRTHEAALTDAASAAAPPDTSPLTQGDSACRTAHFAISPSSEAAPTMSTPSPSRRRPLSLVRSAS